MKTQEDKTLHATTHGLDVSYYFSPLRSDRMNSFHLSLPPSSNPPWDHPVCLGTRAPLRQCRNGENIRVCSSACVDARQRERRKRTEEVKEMLGDSALRTCGCREQERQRGERKQMRWNRDWEAREASGMRMVRKRKRGVIQLRAALYLETALAHKDTTTLLCHWKTRKQVSHFHTLFSNSNSRNEANLRDILYKTVASAC